MEEWVKGIRGGECVREVKLEHVGAGKGTHVGRKENLLHPPECFFFGNFFRVAKIKNGARVAWVGMSGERDAP